MGSIRRELHKEPRSLGKRDPYRFRVRKGHKKRAAFDVTSGKNKEFNPVGLRQGQWQEEATGNKVLSRKLVGPCSNPPGIHKGQSCESRSQESI